jgi:(p)ppGpp synthase/HD superfamily hydrolase
MGPEFDPALQLAPQIKNLFWFLRTGHFEPEQVKEWIEAYGPRSREHKDRLFKAYETIVIIFAGATRKSGGPASDHPVAVMLILMIALGVKDVDILCAALFHDVIEDYRRGKNGWSRMRVEQTFNAVVARYVWGLSKKEISPLHSKFQVEQLYREFMMKAEAAIVLIKLADWLHNLVTPWKTDQRHLTFKVLETIYFYLVLARRHSSPLHRLLFRWLSHQANFLNEKYDLGIY